MEDETKIENLKTIIEKLSNESGLSYAASTNLFIFHKDVELATYLEINPADIDCIFSGESSSLVGDLFGLTNAEIQNLIDTLGKEFVVGMLFSKIILNNDK